MLKALKRSSRGFVMVWPSHQWRRIFSPRPFLTFCPSEFVSNSTRERKQTSCEAVMTQHVHRYFPSRLDSRRIRPHHFHRQAWLAALVARSRDRKGIADGVGDPEFRDAGVAWWVVSHRPRHWRGGGSDLPDHVIPVR